MIFSKTETGQQAFKVRSALLSARQRSAFILFDGVKSTDQVLAATSGLGITQNDIDHLVEHGFLEAAPGAADVSAAAASASAIGSGAPEPQTAPVSARSIGMPTAIHRWVFYHIFSVSIYGIIMFD